MLTGVGQAAGAFTVQVTTDGRSYNFSVKDAKDPCGFAYFSDQNGLIYSAQQPQR